MEVIPDFAGATMRDFVTRNIAPGTTIHSDGLNACSAGLPERAYQLAHPGLGGTSEGVEFSEQGEKLVPSEALKAYQAFPPRRSPTPTD
jgi:hypothetical protein